MTTTTRRSGAQARIEERHVEVAEKVNIFAARRVTGYNRRLGKDMTEVVWHRYGRVWPECAAPCGEASPLTAELPRALLPVKVTCEDCALTPEEIAAADEILTRR